MDDAAISTRELDLSSGDNELQTEHDVAMTSAPASPTKSGRATPRWAALGGALAGVLVAFGAGYAINAGDADAVRDDLNGQIDSLDGDLESAEENRAATEAALDQCRDAVEGASALAEAADTVAGDFQELERLVVQYVAAPVGSPEEAELETAMAELETQLFGKVGALSASADRVTADSEACGAA
ncbi:MAG: hypothetical protein ABWZ52_10230 [Acidimicrobiales bacterium]